MKFMSGNHCLILQARVVRGAILLARNTNSINMRVKTLCTVKPLHRTGLGLFRVSQHWDTTSVYLIQRRCRIWLKEWIWSIKQPRHIHRLLAYIAVQSCCPQQAECCGISTKYVPFCYLAWFLQVPCVLAEVLSPLTRSPISEIKLWKCWMPCRSLIGPKPLDHCSCPLLCCQVS